MDEYLYLLTPPPPKASSGYHQESAAPTLYVHILNQFNSFLQWKLEFSAAQIYSCVYM